MKIKIVQTKGVPFVNTILNVNKKREIVKQKKNFFP